MNSPPRSNSTSSALSSQNNNSSPSNLALDADDDKSVSSSSSTPKEASLTTSLSPSAPNPLPHATPTPRRRLPDHLYKYNFHKNYDDDQNKIQIFGMKFTDTKDENSTGNAFLSVPDCLAASSPDVFKKLLGFVKSKDNPTPQLPNDGFIASSFHTIAS